MVRKTFYLHNAQYRFLKRLGDLTVSEHVRRAIDEYVERKQNLNASKSESATGGEKYGSD
jgi:hypothetical protein